MCGIIGAMANVTDVDTPVLYVKRGHVAYVTLNRPAVLNAMDLRTHELLGSIWDEIAADDEVWLTVLTGAGDRAFSVGQDLKELAGRIHSGTARPSSFGSGGAAGWPRFTERFDWAKPTIARVSGYALGGGCELALACDIIVAADNAEFGLPEARLGLIPGAGGVFRLTRQMPYRTAMGYLMTGRRLDAAEAHRHGLINEVVPADQLDEAVDGWVRDILACAPLSVRAIREAARESAHLPLAEAFAGHYPWEERRRDSRDALEGPAAFAEKRHPRWTGA
jgi:dehydration protein DpgD